MFRFNFKEPKRRYKKIKSLQSEPWLPLPEIPIRYICYISANQNRFPMNRHEQTCWRSPSHGRYRYFPMNTRFRNLFRGCCHICEKLAESLGRELNIPDYLYAYAAQSPERKHLSIFLSGEFEGFAKVLLPEWKPDFGPAAFKARTGQSVIKYMYAESKLEIFGGAPNGRGGPQNKNEIENKYVHDIRPCQNRGLKI